MSQTWLVLLGIILTGAGSIVVLIPMLAMTKEQIIRFSANTYEVLPGLRKAFFDQRKFAIVGVVLMVAGTSALAWTALSAG
ncbi:MAG TPA: hypothetical protein VEO96_07690 [Thermoplasmata archaeon]|nr:hypothetical protein [Thermoplasmata archaeon]